MSTFPSTRLKIKSGDGWFAADRSWQSAAQKLSDGAPLSSLFTSRWAPNGARDALSFVKATWRRL